MLVLTIRTDNPEAELGLYDGETKLEYETWHAHRELSVAIHQKIEHMLHVHDKTWENLEGIVVFEGPGSFTGLRIGITVADALAYGLGIPIVATKDDDWLKKGIARLHAGEQDEIALPFYGRDAHITTPRK